VIDELKQAIRKARLSGARDTDMQSALQIVQEHEKEVEQLAPPPAQLATPRSADETQVRQTALMIERAALAEAEKRKRLEDEMKDQEKQAVELTHRKSVIVPGGPAVEYDRSSSDPAAKRKLTLQASHGHSASISKSDCDQLSVFPADQGRPSDSMVVMEEGICRVVRVSNENWNLNVNELEHSKKYASPEDGQIQEQKAGKEESKVAQETHCCQCLIL